MEIHGRQNAIDPRCFHGQTWPQVSTPQKLQEILTNILRAFPAPRQGGGVLKAHVAAPRTFPSLRTILAKERLQRITPNQSTFLAKESLLRSPSYPPCMLFTNADGKILFMQHTGRIFPVYVHQASRLGRTRYRQDAFANAETADVSGSCVHPGGLNTRMPQDHSLYTRRQNKCRAVNDTHAKAAQRDPLQRGSQ